MMMPCEYCQAPVEGEPFMRLGVPPCCKGCSAIPLVVGAAGLLMFLALALTVIVQWPK